MIWQTNREMKLAAAERIVDQTLTKVDRCAVEIANIGRALDRLSLACQAMWELLRERSDLTEDDIEAKILEIDGRDGRVDGQIGASVMTCTACGRPTNSRRDTCVMCGAPVKGDHKFEGSNPLRSHPYQPLAVEE